MGTASDFSLPGEILKLRYHKVLILQNCFERSVGKKSSLLSEDTYKYPVILFSVKLMITELQILLSELFPVHLFQQYICKITIFLCKDISDLSGERGLGDLIKSALGNSALQLVFLSLFFYFLFFPRVTKCHSWCLLNRSSPLCWC